MICWAFPGNVNQDNTTELHLAASGHSPNRYYCYFSFGLNLSVCRYTKGRISYAPGFCRDQREEEE